MQGIAGAMAMGAPSMAGGITATAPPVDTQGDLPGSKDAPSHLETRTIRALLGYEAKPEAIYKAFISEYGMPAFRALAARVESAKRQQQGQQGRMIDGPGGPRDDMVPAMIDHGSHQQPARLSPGEYVVNAPTVAALGDGDPMQGAAQLDQMSRNAQSRMPGFADGGIVAAMR